MGLERTRRVLEFGVMAWPSEQAPTGLKHVISTAYLFSLAVLLEIQCFLLN